MHFFRDTVPEIAAVLGAGRAVDIVGQDVVDEVGRHVSGMGEVGPFAWGMVAREAVAPVFFYGDEVAAEYFELCSGKYEFVSERLNRGLEGRLEKREGVEPRNIQLVTSFGE